MHSCQVVGTVRHLEVGGGNGLVKPCEDKGKASNCTAL